jgi:DNA primase
MDAVEEVKSRLSVEDVISEYIQLKRSGRNFKGLSPWTNEKTASLMVSPEKQIWHDFSSGKGGNIFSFIMEVEGLEFREALQLLARKAGVELEKFNRQTTAGASSKEALFKTLELACNFYQRKLTSSKSALDYVRHKRNISKQSIIDFKLGYSPNGPDELYRFLLSKKINANLQRQAGLITYRNGRYFDMFRDRLMIPLADQQGRIIGFTARLLAENPEAPKYINTPATPIYDKSLQVYGLHLAKEQVRKSGFVVVVEGNLDVISSHQAGVKNVVATAGTSMTAGHLKTLKRFCADIRLCFDQDPAGQNATERIIEISQSLGVNLSIISISGAKDPDELIQTDLKSWQEAISKPVYAVDWVFNEYATKLDLNSATGKRQFTDEAARIIQKISDPVERDHYLSLAANLAKVNLAALKQKLDNKSTAKQRFKKISVQPVSKTSDNLVLEQNLLALALVYPACRLVLSYLPTAVFSTSQSRLLHQFLSNNLTLHINPERQLELKDLSDYVKILVLLCEERYQNTEQQELAYQSNKLAGRLVAEYVKNQKRLLIEKLKQTSDDETTKLLIEVKQLDELNDKLRLKLSS